MFQTSVSNNIGFGVPGALAFEGPLRAQPGVLNSTDAASNVIGRAFTVRDDATGSFDTAADPQPMEMQAGGTGVFAGILADPHVYANFGTAAGGTLAQNLQIPNGAMAEFVEETAGIVVQLTAAAAVGDFAYFRNADGVILTAAPASAAPAASTRIPGGRVVRYETAAAGLAVIAFNSTAVA